MRTFQRNSKSKIILTGSVVLILWSVHCAPPTVDSTDQALGAFSIPFLAPNTGEYEDAEHPADIVEPLEADHQTFTTAVNPVDSAGRTCVNQITFKINTSAITGAGDNRNISGTIYYNTPLGDVRLSRGDFVLARDAGGDVTGLSGLGTALYPDKGLLAGNENPFPVLAQVGMASGATLEELGIMETQILTADRCYLYFSTISSYGLRTADQTSTALAYARGSILIDPTDPAVILEMSASDGLGIKVQDTLVLGFSANANFIYSPTTTPSSTIQSELGISSIPSFNANLFIRSKFPIPGSIFQADGTVFMNYQNISNQEVVLGINGALSLNFQILRAAGALGESASILGELGTVELGTGSARIDLSASDPQLQFALGTSSALGDIISNSPLSSFAAAVSPTFGIYGNFNFLDTSTWSLAMEGSYSFGGIGLEGYMVLRTSHVAILGSVNLGTLKVSVAGAVQSNGDFSLSGTVTHGFSLGSIASAKARVSGRLENTGGIVGLSFSAELQGCLGVCATVGASVDTSPPRVCGTLLGQTGCANFS